MNITFRAFVAAVVTAAAFAVAPSAQAVMSSNGIMTNGIMTNGTNTPARSERVATDASNAAMPRVKSVLLPDGREIKAR